jgi:DNA-binding MarR family transcriptional regulator
MTIQLTPEQQKKFEKIKREFLQRVEKHTEQYRKRVKTIMKRIEEKKLQQLRNSLNN